MDVKEKYGKVFDLIAKLGLFVGDVSQIKSMADRHIFKSEVESFGIPIELYHANGWCYSEIGEYAHIVTLDGENRTISWPDDDRQPCGRFLNLSFSSGAYIFGDDYPTEFFSRFFDELKLLSPVSIDSANKCLYFVMEDAGVAFHSYKEIHKKYREENRIDALRRKAKKAEADLAKLVAQFPPAGSP
jgi:hypothetical protein